MRISVVGTGYVGLVSGACFAQVGHHCVCVDVDESKVKSINQGKAPIHEKGLEDLLARVVGSRLTATTDLAKAVADSEVTFIAVGTPFDGKTIDLSYVKAAATQIGEALARKSGFHVVVVKSTVVPGTTDDVVLPLLEKASGKRAGIDFGVGMNPEFLTEGTAIDDFMQPDRIVIGGSDAKTLALQREIYASFEDTPIVEVNNKTAEMIKYVSNAVLATLISFSNEIGNMCAAMGGIDVANVMRGVHLARYFAPRIEDGRRVRAPITSFLWPGCGYGGSCLPKDTKALAAHSARHGQGTPLLDAVIQTNLDQPKRMLQLVEKHFPSLRGLRVTVLGLAFKEDTDDLRESPSLTIVNMLVDRGVRVTAYDPIAIAPAKRVLPSAVRYADGLGDAVSSADAVLLLTRWAEFNELPELLRAMKSPPLLIDGRRMLEPATVPRYEGIGL